MLAMRTVLVLLLLVACDASVAGIPFDGAAPSDGRIMADGHEVPDARPACAANETPIAGECCALAKACGSTCCAASNSCQAGECHLDCGAGQPAPCGPTGGSEHCCAASDVCYLEACATPGVSCHDIYDCGKAAYCEPTLGRCLTLPPGDLACSLPPAPAGVFTPVIKWEWTDSPILPGCNQVMMQPVVADVSGDGIPDVLFHTFGSCGPSPGGTYGLMRAISGDSGADLWTVTDPAWATTYSSGIAIADLDGDSVPEILACGYGGSLLAFEHDGTPRWATSGVVCGGYSAPAVANLDDDDLNGPEIVVGFQILNADGTLRLDVEPLHYNATSFFTTLADLDGDGRLDIVAGEQAVDASGHILWQHAQALHPYNSFNYPAVADLDGDGAPDVAEVSYGSQMVMAYRGADGTDLWPAPVSVNSPPNLGVYGGGPPTIADFDGDGKPEVAVAGGYSYGVFEGEDGTPKFFKPTEDRSSGFTGSSVFDFESDGSAEIVYADERHLHVYRGSDGADLFTACNTSGTLAEYPDIVDVDGDGHAEIVVARNNFADYAHTCDDGSPSHTGIAVFGDALGNWVPTRKIWNQHTYHITNVNEDSTIPVHEVANWTVPGLNNFRQNVQFVGVLATPNLVIPSFGASLTNCAHALLLQASIKNVGSAGVPAGISVAFYRVTAPGKSELIGHAMTTTALLPGESAIVSFDWPLPAGHEHDSFSFLAAVDDDGLGTDPGKGAGMIAECNESDNVSAVAVAACNAIE